MLTPEIEAKFASYPAMARKRLEKIRRLILAVAKENNLGPVEETLKWGEPSYLVKGGSTVRMDWKPRQPEIVKIYFHCKTNLIETFKEVYSDEFTFEGNRAIVISLESQVNEMALSHCVELSLKYHSLKHLPLLGV